MYNDHILKVRRQELRRRATDAEMALWQRLRKRSFAGLRFFRQYSVGPYILDFFCPEIRLAIELDGKDHSVPGTKYYDADRTAFLSGHDIRVVRFWNRQVIEKMEEVLAILFEKIKTPSCCKRGQGELS